MILDDDTRLGNSFVVPDAALADVPAAPRAPDDPTPRAAGFGGERSDPRERPDREVENPTVHHHWSYVS
jgi:hypothetical protein